MASPLRTAALLLSLTALLTGCDAPQGVGYVGQVLAGSDNPAADFTVVPVTAKTIPMIAKWPGQPPATRTVGWLPRGGGVKHDIVLAGDKLDVGMWSNEENGLLTNPGQKFANMPAMAVSAAGSLFLPYAGDVHVAGMTVTQARAAIQAKLAKIMPSVQVTLGHAAGRGNSVQVVSGLPKAGMVPLPDHDFTILDLISTAGGIPPAMVNPQVDVARGGKLYGIAFSKLVQDPKLNAVLRPGDRIYVVPEKRYFLSFGQAQKEAQIPFPQAKVTALDAVSLVGGLVNNLADPKGVLILRHYPASAVRKGNAGPDKQRMIFAFNLLSADGLFSAGQFQIENKDLVLVTQSPLVNQTVLINALTRILGVPAKVVNAQFNINKL